MALFHNVKQYLSSFSSINFLYALNSTFCYYFCFSCSKLFNNLMRWCCALWLFFICLCHLLFFGISFFNSEFILYSLLSLFTANKGMIAYFELLKNVDRKMSSLAIPLLTKNQKLVLIFVASLRIIPILVRAEQVIARPFFHFVLTYEVVALDVAHLTRMFVFYVLYNRMKRLRKLFKTKLAVISITEREQAGEKVKEIRSLVIAYSQLLDCLEQVDGEMQTAMLITLICCFVGAMQIIYQVIAYNYLQGIVTYSHISIFFEYTYYAIFGLLPSVVVEQAANQARLIERHLRKRLAYCNDGRLRSELQHAANVFCWRPVRLRVFRCIPIDATTSLRFVGLCINYTVVMLQFVDFNVKIE